jgi:hypothetical protein
MITMNRIQSLVNGKAWRKLLREVIENGRPVSAAIYDRLTSPDVLAVAATAFALQRVIELSYTKSSLSTRLAGLLASFAREKDGSFAESVSGTAVAVRALAEYQRHPAGSSRQSRVGGGLDDGQQIETAIANGLAWLAEQQSIDTGLVGTDLVDSVICLWQLEGAVGLHGSCLSSSSGTAMQAGVDNSGLRNRHLHEQPGRLRTALIDRLRIAVMSPTADNNDTPRPALFGDGGFGQRMQSRQRRRQQRGAAAA